MSCKLTRLIEQVREAQQVLELLPCGGIGPEGATQDDLDDAAEDGRCIENDAMVDIGQRCWRMLERAIKDEEEVYFECDILSGSAVYEP